MGDQRNYLFKGCHFILMATQRIASASARGAVTHPKLSKIEKSHFLIFNLVHNKI